jgi:hypothetical protein
MMLPIHAGEKRDRLRPTWRVFFPLLLVVFVGTVVWIIYGLSSNAISVFGNCGPRDFLNFQGGHLEGGASSSATAAAAIGGVLAAAAALALWHAPRSWRRIVLTYVGVYGAALLVLAFVVSPIAWGHERCVIP